MTVLAVLDCETGDLRRYKRTARVHGGAAFDGEVTYRECWDAVRRGEMYVSRQEIEDFRAKGTLAFGPQPGPQEVA